MALIDWIGLGIATLVAMPADTLAKKGGLGI
jgi:hypothetical protein